MQVIEGTVASTGPAAVADLPPCRPPVVTPPKVPSLPVPPPITRPPPGFVRLEDHIHPNIGRRAFRAGARTRHGRFAIEIVSGCGRLTGAWRELGLKWMPPIELSESGFFDITNRRMLDWVLRLIRSGKVWFVHLAPPCVGRSIAGPGEQSSQRSASVATPRHRAHFARVPAEQHRARH